MISLLVPFVLNGPFSAPEQSSASYDCFNSLAFVIYMHNHFYLPEQTLQRLTLFLMSFNSQNLIAMKMLFNFRWAPWSATSGTCRTTWTRPWTGRTRPWTVSTPRPTATSPGSRWLTTRPRSWWSKLPATSGCKLWYFVLKPFCKSKEWVWPTIQCITLQR